MPATDQGGDALGRRGQRRTSRYSRQCRCGTGAHHMATTPHHLGEEVRPGSRSIAG
uniref:Uncharacterized protein n=1 Tax=Arundo donax TaxID=35708 RepID=A0A0A9BJH6_ARUDO